MATSTPTNSISDEEAFANSYRVFSDCLEALSKEPAETCEWYGHFNVAYEVKDDVSAGSYLLNNPSCPFSPEQRAALTGLVEALDSIPESITSFTQVKPESLAKMEHPSWVPIRAQAGALVKLLEPVTRANANYLYGKG